jgi:hypothetical protein
MENYIDIIEEIPFVPDVDGPVLMPTEQLSSSRSFIEANTIECSLMEMNQHHVIPVWLKDNEPLISNADFIEVAREVVADIFCGEQILKPAIRVSHPIKGRIPSAKDKPANLLTDEERTLFYERMMFCIEVPSIKADVDGNQLSLIIGGVKSFGEDNLYQRSGGEQHFKLFMVLKKVMYSQKLELIILNKKLN